MMNVKAMCITAVAAALFLTGTQITAEEKQCKLYPEGGLLAQSYELVGAEACKQACTETENCTAWSYTPHNFNPTSAPGQCRMMSAVSEEVEHDRDFCGRL